jgi:hypothetical protein
MQSKYVLPAAGVLVLAGFLAACNHEYSASKENPMGETVTVGPLRYNVIESNWYGQLGEGFKIRSAQQRFLAISVSITNGGGSDVAVPLLSVENSSGQSFVEVENGDGLNNWMGLLRNVSPAQTVQGRILFDVPMASYRLRLSDGSGAGVDKYSWVAIPLHIDTDTGVQTPAPGDIGK